MIYSNGDFITKFETALSFDNCDPVTLKLKPSLWDCEQIFTEDFRKYCRGRDIDYVLYREVGAGGNVHYHGIIIYPFYKTYKNFTSWFNKYYGKIHKSEKGDAIGWHNYCVKQQRPNEGDLMDPVPYLFDPQYEA